MREIKFRGYNKELGKWIIGSYVDGFIINGVIESNEEYIVIEEWFPVEIESVGQYTGLKDENGVEIYEGNIVEIQNTNETSTSYITDVFISPLGVLVKPHPAHKMIGIDRYRLLADFIDYGVGYQFHLKCKIIGNIYENPELLEVE